MRDDDDNVNDDLFPIGDAPNHFPRQPNGKKVNRSTIYRWITRGVWNRGKTKRVHLAVLRIGGRTYITTSAIQDFIRKINDEDKDWGDEYGGGACVPKGPPKPICPGGLSARAETAEQVAQRIVGAPQKAIRREFTGFSKPTPHSDDTGIAEGTLPPDDYEANRSSIEALMRRRVKGRSPQSLEISKHTSRCRNAI